jgi:hypothetical protein
MTGNKCALPGNASLGGLQRIKTENELSNSSSFSKLDMLNKMNIQKRIMIVMTL